MASPQIVVGVAGGVAAYKTAALVSQLAQHGVRVIAVLTPAAERFITPATFAALTSQPVVRDLFDERYPLGAHIELAEQAELLCIAPATADFLAKAANGLADDLLSTLYLAFTKPVVMAPAMNTAMWRHPAVQRNVAQVQADGVTLVGPDAGWLACRQQGPGRMTQPEELARFVLARLGK